MKKFLTIISAILLASSCTEAIQEETNHENEAITANITPQTRTSMGAGEDGIYKVLWSDGDDIIVSDGMLEGVYTAAAGGSSSAVFIPKSRIPMDFSNGVIAGYPVENMFLGGPDLEEDVYFTIPSVQEYTEGSFDDLTMPMISDIAYEPVLNFRNAAGVLKFMISGDETLSLASVTIKADQTMSGDMCYNPGSQLYDMDAAMTPYDNIVLDCGDGVEIGQEATAFHVVVPHQTYTGITVTLLSTDGKQHIFRMKEDRKITVSRGSVATIPLKFNTFGTSTKPEISLSCSKVSFTSFDVSVSMKNVTSYFCGLQSKASFHNDMESGNLIEGLSWKTEYTAPLSFSGAIERFQEEMKDMLIEPGHDYVFWIVPSSASGTYTNEDVRYIEVTTSSYTGGGSTGLIASNIVVDMTSISLTLTASGSATMVYNVLLDEDDMALYPEEQDKINLLLGGSAYFFEKSSDIVIRKFLSPGTKYTLLAIAIDYSGRYGKLFQMEFTTEQIPYNDIQVSIAEDMETLHNEQKISWETTGGTPVEYRYIFTSTDRHLWTGTLEASVRKAGETMYLNPGLYYISKTTDSSAYVTMENGKEYIFILLAVDSDGNCSVTDHWKFTY